ncbi:MAG: hypothetical protein JF570_06245, partial [Caulobacter sp.]|nr:hypothetical protein [Caulobacter sp.]
DALAHVTDIEPTVLSLAGVARPASYRGLPLAPAIGHSWAGLLAGKEATVRGSDETVAWELFFRRAVRQGDWKAVYLPAAPGGAAYSREAVLPANWELFDLKNDPAESRDLAASEPARLQTLIEAWNRYAAENGVILPPPVPSAAGKAGGR